MEENKTKQKPPTGYKKQNLQIQNIHSGIPQWLELFTWLDKPIKPVENKARYFMPTHIWVIKDSETPSFKLILNPQKENLQIISAPNLTILVVQH